MATQEDSVFKPLAQPDNVVESLLPRVLASRKQRRDIESVSTPVVATLVEFGLDDRPVIRSDRLLGGELVVARAAVMLRQAHLGCSVVVLCENGDPALPIIMGVMESRARESASEPGSGKRAEVRADGERYVVDAEREIVLRCGESSITLTRAGKVIIKGRYILSRSSGYNKIKGAAVDIN